MTLEWFKQLLAYSKLYVKKATFKYGNKMPLFKTSYFTKLLPHFVLFSMWMSCHVFASSTIEISPHIFNGPDHMFDMVSFQHHDILIFYIY